MKKKSTFFAKAIFLYFKMLFPQLSLSKFGKDFLKTRTDTSFYLKFALRFLKLFNNEWKPRENELSKLWDYAAVDLTEWHNPKFFAKVFSENLANKNKIKVA